MEATPHPPRAVALPPKAVALPRPPRAVALPQPPRAAVPLRPRVRTPGLDSTSTAFAQFSLTWQFVSLTGGKGSPPTGKGKGSGPLSCTTIPILFYQKDITAAEYTNSAGFGLKEVPFYNPTTLEQLGTYSDFAVDIPESDECVADGAFSFGLNPDTGSYDSQITIAFTCGSAQNSITGGSGAYGCATGYEVFAYQDDAAGLLGTELVLCGPLCPNVLIESTAP